MPITVVKHGIISRRTEGSFRYHAWGSIAKLTDGTIAAACSAGRNWHICPFGKTHLYLSKDEGETWSSPIVVNDTWLDDRDVGLCALPNGGLLLTWFTTGFDLLAERDNTIKMAMTEGEYEMMKAYQKTCIENPNMVCGRYSRVSHDGGLTWSEPRPTPCSSPHGPTVLSDGTILWVGRLFEDVEGVTYIHAYSMTPDGQMERLGEIEDIPDGDGRFLSCEPHAIELPDGRILCQIRVQRPKPNRVFTLYQSESADGGRTWTKPAQLLEPCGGAPAHLLLLSNGVLISVYGYRMEPYGIRVMVSHDLGRTWEKDLVLCDGFPTGDLGYPATVELNDGTLLTVFYAREENSGPAVIMQQKWKLFD